MKDFLITVISFWIIVMSLLDHHQNEKITALENEVKSMKTQMREQILIDSVHTAIIDKTTLTQQ